MYIYYRLRGGNRFAGGSLETFAAILVGLQAEREGWDFFGCLSINLHLVYFSPAAREEPVCRWVSRGACGDLVRLQVGREGGDFVLAPLQ